MIWMSRVDRPLRTVNSHIPSWTISKSSAHTNKPSHPSILPRAPPVSARSSTHPHARQPQTPQTPATQQYQQTKKEGTTHRENNNNPLLSLDHNAQIKPHLKPFERLMDENVLDAARGDEARARRANVATRGGRGLHSKASNDEEGLRRVKAASDEVEEEGSESETVGSRCGFQYGHEGASDRC